MGKKNCCFLVTGELEPYCSLSNVLNFSEEFEGRIASEELYRSSVTLPVVELQLVASTTAVVGAVTLV